MTDDISTLTGAELDCAVAKADGRIDPHIKDGECLITHGIDGPIVRFDAVWFKLQILPRESAKGLVVTSGSLGKYEAGYDERGTLKHKQAGATPYEALMRAFVSWAEA
jgi:hypothetical protein